jgi:antitoxin component YwqK of YwqJK toxin-antitoxin module
MRLDNTPSLRAIWAGLAETRRATRLAGLAALALLVGLGVWWLCRPAPQAMIRPELTRPQLVLREGRLFASGQSRAFTGNLVEYFQNGALKSRSTVSNGLLQGVSEGWHTNGLLAVREHFVAGVSHGLRVKWYPSGATLSKVEIINGKLQGTFQRWYENGSLAEEIPMRQGQADGHSRAYYPSGYLKAQATMHQGELAEQKFWKDGERRE